MVDFKRLRLISLLDVCKRLNIPLKRSAARQYRGKCPFCGTKNVRSLVITVPENIFYTFCCSEHGDALELVHKYVRIPKVDAATWLIENFGLPP